MRLVDDLPSAVVAVLNADPVRSHHARRVRERDALLEAIPRREHLVAQLSTQWAPHRVQSGDLALVDWVRSRSDLQEAARFFETEAWAGDASESALRRLEADGMAGYLVALRDLDWVTLMAATASLTEWGEHVVSVLLGDHAHQDAAFSSRLRCALLEVPTEPDAWIPAYARERSGVAEHVVSLWAKRRASGRLGADAVFLPSGRQGISLISLLLPLDPAAFFDLVERLPLAQICDDVLRAACRTSTELLDVVRHSPALPSPAVHGSLVVAIEQAVGRIHGLREAIKPIRHPYSGGADEAMLNSAAVSFCSWRDDWIDRVVVALSAREDSRRVLLELVANALDSATRADAAERRDEARIEDAWVVAQALGRALHPIPTPLRDTPEDLRAMDGSLASWLLKALLQPEGRLQRDEADSLWEDLIAVVRSAPNGAQWAAGEGQVFLRAMNGMPAGVLCDTTNPADAWLAAWRMLAPARAIARRKEGFVHEVRHAHSWMVLVGGLTAYELVRRAAGCWTEGALLLWDRVAEGSAEMGRSLPYAREIGLDGPGRSVLLLLKGIPEHARALQVYVRFAGRDPYDAAHIARVALASGVEAGVVVEVFGAAGADVLACLQEMHDCARPQEKAAWVDALMRLRGADGNGVVDP